jgi:hypothetical protein
MLKLSILLLLTLPIAAQTQAVVSADSSSSANPIPDNSYQTSQPASSPNTTNQDYFGRVLGPRREGAPIASFAGTATYVFTDGYAGHNRSLWGFTATPEVNFGKYLGLQADFTQLYMSGIYPGRNRLILAAGPRINFAPRSKFTPFIFLEGGEIRLTQQNLYNISDWNPVAKAGFGFDHKLKHGFGFQLIPGEYIGQYQDDGTWLHSFSARAGLSFSLFR